MRKVDLVTVKDGNMAGFQWQWQFLLSRRKDRTFSVTAKQYFIAVDPESGSPIRLKGHYRLRRGDQILDALADLIEEAGYDPSRKILVEDVAYSAELLSPQLASEIRQASDVGKTWKRQEIAHQTRRKEEKFVQSEPNRSDQFTDPVTGMEFVFVKGGRFEMGDTFGLTTFDGGQADETPVHEVVVGDFHIGKFEVTQGQWQKVMGNYHSSFERGDDYPVDNVSWNEVQQFIEKLNEKTGKKYRLPTEAEWEYAARSGGKKERWAGTSSELEKYAWHDDNSGGRTHPVGLKKPNGLGLYDMSGNVWEWCQDYYGEDFYKNSAKDNPKGPATGEKRVRRGGSYFSLVDELRTSYRFGGFFRLWAEGGNTAGFRLVLSSE